MTSAVTQQDLDETLKLFARHANDEIDLVELRKVVNNYAARVLSERRLIGFNFTESVAGSFKVRKTGPVLTPLGVNELERIQAR